MLNGEWVDSFRTLSDLNYRHSPLYRTTTRSSQKSQATCTLNKKGDDNMKLKRNVVNKSKKKKFKRRKTSKREKGFDNIPISIPIQRSFSDSFFHAGNIQRSASDDSRYSGIPLNSPFRTITDMFDVASIARHRNFYFQSN